MSPGPILGNEPGPYNRGPRYSLRSALLSNEVIEVIATFRCEATAECAMDAEARRMSGEGELYKLQILEDGEVINERYVA